MKSKTLLCLLAILAAGYYLRFADVSVAHVGCYTSYSSVPVVSQVSCADNQLTPQCTETCCPPGGSGTGSGPAGGPGGNPGGGSRGCGGCTLNSGGMIEWSVSEPNIILQFHDRPLWYNPPIGPGVAFDLYYRQVGNLVEDTNIFSLGPHWSCSLRSFVCAPNWGSGQASFHRGGAGYIPYSNAVPQVRDGSYVSAITGGYQIAYPNGKVDTFTTAFSEGGTNVYFLSFSTDPAGNSLTYSYATVSGVLRLTSLTDAAGQVTHLYYGNTTFSNLVTRVEDPFSRTNFLAYDVNGYLTNITDVAGLKSGVAYDFISFTNVVATNLATPYGQTSFRYDGTDYGGATSQVTDAIEVTLPTGGKELFVNLYYASFLTSWTPTVPTTTPYANTFEDASAGNLPFYNSFHWNPFQYQSLSSAYTLSNNVADLTSTDFAIGRLRHWLIDSSGNISSALSLERAPSPDAGGATPGQVTWYDYENKYGGFTTGEGTSDWPSFVAQVLPDGSTHFDYSTRGPFLNVTNRVSTYTAPGGFVALRTNIYTFAANAIDLLQWLGPEGEQVVSNYFAPGNTIHLPNASFDALNQETDYTYNAYGQITSVITPAGLTTTNLYYSSGASIDRLQTTIDVQITRTNGFTWYANGLLNTQTDERGLTTTFYWDNLQRLTGSSYPDSTTTSNLYTCLDLTASKDRLGYWSYSLYNALRQRIVETNANGAVTGYNYCQCGLLFAVTNAWNTSVQMVTSYGYDNQGNRLFIYLPDATVTNWFDDPGRLIQSCDAWGCR